MAHIAKILWTIASTPFVHALVARNVSDTPHTRKAFHVGGEYVPDISESHVLANQMYVEQLTPIEGATKPHPLVFIHGLAQTGMNWLTKPDGNPGWASYFLAHGYECYVVDVPARGRSPWLLPSDSNVSEWMQNSAETVQELFTAPELYDQYEAAKLHTQWPGKGVKGDPVFDNYFASNTPSRMNATWHQSAVQNAGSALVKMIGKPVILIGHSQGGVAPWLIADRNPNLVCKIVALEPTGPPFQDSVLFGQKAARAWGLSDIPLTYYPRVEDPHTDIPKKTIPAENGREECILQADEPQPRQLVNLRAIEVAVVSAEASWHAPYDWCTAAFLSQAGVNTKLVELAKEGVKGNGHMLMMEKNSDEVAAVVRSWIEQS
ncbi:alpha/beta-hydrolase [Corynespora cassiicola Philippines]|uniref:Alpha/beta-hydrolase n=1 Tax=Corynespora cassiicola Philippines TaxID=1448308 RepID=A0A2T2N8W2_CORCC|nr:alpha/beta-hydrolase [Corynespora cassiicola Philippines]